jgi:hypothetical protein
MSLSTSTSRVAYNGDGSTVAFTFPYYFLANADLKVYVGGVLKTLTTDYSVSGAGVAAGGTVTMVVAPSAGTGNLVILRDPDQLQSSQLPSNDPFPSKTVETGLDKVTMLVQRCRDLLTRTFTLADSDVSGASTILPTPSANKALFWNSSATGLENRDLSSVATVGTNDVHALTSKGTPASNDETLLLDSAASWAAKKLTIGNLATYLAGLCASSWTSFSTAFAASAGMPQVSKSVNYTTLLTDANGQILHPVSDANNRTFTIDSNANVAYPIGTTLTFINEATANTVTVAITSDTLMWAGVGSTGSRTIAAYGLATAVKITATKWLISGTGLS